nr:acyltransferase family protein [Prevotella sp.]
MKGIFYSSFKRLIIPYILFSFISIIIYYLFHNSISFSHILKTSILNTLYDEAPYYDGPLWFLLSLFIIRISFSLFYKIKINIITTAILSFICAFALNYILNILKPNPYLFALGEKHIPIILPYYWGNIFCGLAYYCCGFILRCKQYNKYLVIISALIFIIHLFIINNFDFRFNDLQKGNGTYYYFIEIIFSLSGIILFNNLFKTKLNKKIPILTHIGQNSMIYFVTHYILLYCCLDFIDKKEYNVWLIYIIKSLITIMFLYIQDKIFTHKKLKWMIGSK